MTTINNFLQTKTAMETYYLRKKLPEAATLPKAEPLKKTFDFYKDNTNLWDRPAQTCKKIYQFYHKNRDSKQKNIIHRQEMNIFDRMLLEEKRKAQLLNEKEEARSRMATRKLERKVLQYESHQKLDGLCNSDETFKSTLQNKEITENLVNRKIHISMNGRVPNVWNDLNKSSMKSIKIECTKPIILKDEQAAFTIQNKINQEYELERLKKEFFRETREKLRNKFLKKHNENYELEKKAGLTKDENENEQNKTYKF